MKKIENIISATINLDTSNLRFSGEALKMMCEDSIHKLVLDNFNLQKPVGKIIFVKVENNCLIINAEIDEKFIDKYKKQFIVPGYKSIKQILVKNLIVDEEVELVNFGLTTNPTDKNVTFIT